MVHCSSTEVILVINLPIPQVWYVWCMLNNKYGLLCYPFSIIAWFALPWDATCNTAVLTSTLFCHGFSVKQSAGVIIAYITPDTPYCTSVLVAVQSFKIRKEHLSHRCQILYICKSLKFQIKISLLWRQIFAIISWKCILLLHRRVFPAPQHT
jgi:hypothetical protein